MKEKEFAGLNFIYFEDKEELDDWIKKVRDGSIDYRTGEWRTRGWYVIEFKDTYEDTYYYEELIYIDDFITNMEISIQEDMETLNKVRGLKNE